MEKHEFKIGNWYKIKNVNSYRKCKDIPIGDSLPYSDSIQGSTFNKKFNSMCGGLRRLRPATLEEIQEFLPDDHEDKISKNKHNLVEGEYYFHGNDNDGWISIFKEVIDGEVKEEGSVALGNKSFYKGQSYWGPLSRFTKNLRLATPEERAWLDACISAGKFVPRESIKKYKFKIGDNVIGNSKASERYTYTKGGWIGVVNKLNDNHFTANSNLGSPGGGFGLHYECFDLYEEAVISDVPKPQSTSSYVKEALLKKESKTQMNSTVENRKIEFTLKSKSNKLIIK